MFSEICNNCGGSDFRECYERGDYICMECGGCSPEKIVSEGPEKNNYFGGKDNSRVMETDFYLSFSEQNTFIGNGKTPLQLLQNQLVPKTMSLSQNKMSKGFSLAKKYEHMFDLPGQVVDTVKNIIAEFQKAQHQQKKRVNGTTSEEFVIAVIYMALEIHQKGKSFKEVCAMSHVKEKKVRKFIKLVNQIIPEKVKMHSHSPNHHIPEIASIIASYLNSQNENSECKISEFQVERKATDILTRAFNHACNKECSSRVVSGKRPSTLASAAVWIALEEICEEIVQKDGKKKLQCQPEDVACCAQIGKETMMSSVEIIKEHWSSMF